MPTRNFILSAVTARKKMQRMAYEIVERNIDEQQLLIAGIKDSGVIIARKIKTFLLDIFKGEIIVIEISIDKKILSTFLSPVGLILKIRLLL